jgi:hypothetical protein
VVPFTPSGRILPLTPYWPSGSRQPETDLSGASSRECETDSVADEQFTHEAEFYLNLGADPMFGDAALVIGGNVAEVLFAEGIFTEISSALHLWPGFDQYEAQAVPVEALGDLARVCRELAGRYSDPEVQYEAKYWHVVRQTGGESKRSTLVIAATGKELQTALRCLADLADEAATQGVEILAAL